MEGGGGDCQTQELLPIMWWKRGGNNGGKVSVYRACKLVRINFSGEIRQVPGMAERNILASVSD